jgi:hypothetical protein
MRIRREIVVPGKARGGRILVDIQPTSNTTRGNESRRNCVRTSDSGH